MVGKAIPVVVLLLLQGCEGVAARHVKWFRGLSEAEQELALDMDTDEEVEAELDVEEERQQGLMDGFMDYGSWGGQPQ
jgi:hypothetical protein